MLQKIRLTDQSRDAVELGVKRTFSLPGIHFTGFQSENVLLKWYRDQKPSSMTVAISLLIY